MKRKTHDGIGFEQLHVLKTLRQRGGKARNAEALRPKWAYVKAYHLNRVRQLVRRGFVSVGQTGELHITKKGRAACCDPA